MVLVIDNYDSFTYNLVQYVARFEPHVLVRRNDAIALEQIIALQPSGILLSPGPCTPSRSGICLAISSAAMQGKLQREDGSVIPLFGVCLGLQAIGDRAGAVVARASRVVHGKASPVAHDGQGIFEGLPSPLSAVRYHSLSIRRETLPEDFAVSATATDDGEIMGIRHNSLPIEAVQFHPESVLTEYGMEMIQNFVRMTRPG